MKSSMSWEYVKSFWTEPSNEKVKKSATKKGATHKQNPTWKPAKAAMTPKQWHKANRKTK